MKLCSKLFAIEEKVFSIALSKSFSEVAKRCIAIRIQAEERPQGIGLIALFNENMAQKYRDLYHELIGDRNERHEYV